MLRNPASPSPLGFFWFLSFFQRSLIQQPAVAEDAFDFIYAGALLLALVALSIAALMFLLLDAACLGAALLLQLSATFLLQLPLLLGGDLRCGRVVVVAVEHLLEVVVALGEPDEGTFELNTRNPTVQ